MCFLHNYIIGFNNNNNNKELKGEKRPQNTDLGVTNTHRSQLKPRNLLCYYHCWEEKSRKSKGTEGRKRRPQGQRHGHLDKHESTHTSEWVRGKQTGRNGFNQNIFLLAASVTNASPLWGKTFPSLSGSEEWAERKSGLNKGEQREGGASILSPHSQRPGTARPRGWRSSAHLGLHQLLLDAFGGVLTVVQLLQLTLSPLLRLTDVL